jgi:hypothetical protein
VEKGYAHLDTSSISLRGGESEAAQRAVEVMEAVVSRHGYSKEQPPDLK